MFSRETLPEKRSYHIWILIVDGEQLVEQISHLWIENSKIQNWFV